MLYIVRYVPILFKTKHVASCFIQYNLENSFVMCQLKFVVQINPMIMFTAWFPLGSGEHKIVTISSTITEN